MRKLYVIGNGFDLAHDIKSQYSDFRVFMEKSRKYDDLVIMLEEFYENDDFELWSNFETALGLISAKNVYSATKESVDNDDDVEREFRQHQELIHWNASNIKERLADAFCDWTAQISLDRVEPIYRLSTKDLFLTFNYTETLEKIYGVPSENVLHIHCGQHNPVFGHGKKQYDDNWPPENEAYVITDEAVDYTKNLFKVFVKPVENIIRRNETFFFSLKDTIDEVVVIGHSLSEVDMPYFKKIYEIASQSIWTYYYHRNKKYSTKRLQVAGIQAKINSLGIPISQQKIVCDEDSTQLFI